MRTLTAVNNRLDRIIDWIVESKSSDALYNWLTTGTSLIQTLKIIAILPFAMVFMILYFFIVIIPWFIAKGMISVIENFMQK